jgi:hypothetical protein
MRHSGRVLRPPGKEFPKGLLPDLWGFGSESEPRPLVPPYRHGHGSEPPSAPQPPRRRGPLAGIIDLIGKLFG